MSGTGWAITMAIIYAVLVFTVAVLSFRKGHWVLGLLGFIFPLLAPVSLTASATAVRTPPGPTAAS